MKGSYFRQKKLSIVFESARGCQGMVLQLVFDPLAYLQYSALPDHHPGPAAPTIRLRGEQSSTRSCGRRPCGTSCTWWLWKCQSLECTACVWIRGRTAAGSDQSGVVGVEHDLGARALLFTPCQHAALSVRVFCPRARCASVSNVFAPPRTLVCQPTFCHCLRPSWFWWSLCHAGTLFLR